MNPIYTAHVKKSYVIWLVLLILTLPSGLFFLFNLIFLGGLDHALSASRERVTAALIFAPFLLLIFAAIAIGRIRETAFTIELKDTLLTTTKGPFSPLRRTSSLDLALLSQAKTLIIGNRGRPDEYVIDLKDSSGRKLRLELTMFAAQDIIWLYQPLVTAMREHGISIDEATQAALTKWFSLPVDQNP